MSSSSCRYISYLSLAMRSGKVVLTGKVLESRQIYCYVQIEVFVIKIQSRRIEREISSQLDLEYAIEVGKRDPTN